MLRLGRRPLGDNEPSAEEIRKSLPGQRPNTFNYKSLAATSSFKRVTHVYRFRDINIKYSSLKHVKDSGVGRQQVLVLYRGRKGEEHRYKRVALVST